MHAYIHASRPGGGLRPPHPRFQSAASAASDPPDPPADPPPTPRRTFLY